MNKAEQLKMLDDELEHCREQEKTLRSDLNVGDRPRYRWNTMGDKRNK